MGAVNALDKMFGESREIGSIVGVYCEYTSEQILWMFTLPSVVTHGKHWYLCVSVYKLLFCDFIIRHCHDEITITYEGISKSFRTGPTK
jgi:hypothetical protein